MEIKFKNKNKRKLIDFVEQQKVKHFLLFIFIYPKTVEQVEKAPSNHNIII